jgi:hypothetical protein
VDVGSAWVLALVIVVAPVAVALVVRDVVRCPGTNMNADTSAPGREAAKSRLVCAIEWLFKVDDRWRPVPSVGGTTITLRRCWGDATADTVAMSPDITYAVRTDPQGQEVARVEGTAVEVVAAVGGWPLPSPPSEPDSSDSDCVPALSGLST